MRLIFTPSSKKYCFEQLAVFILLFIAFGASGGFDDTPKISEADTQRALLKLITIKKNKNEEKRMREGKEEEIIPLRKKHGMHRAMNEITISIPRLEPTGETRKQCKNILSKMTIVLNSLNVSVQSKDNVYNSEEERNREDLHSKDVINNFSQLIGTDIELLKNTVSLVKNRNSKTDLSLKSKGFEESPLILRFIEMAEGILYGSIKPVEKPSISLLSAMWISSV